MCCTCRNPLCTCEEHYAGYTDQELRDFVNEIQELINKRENLAFRLRFCHCAFCGSEDSFINDSYAEITNKYWVECLHCGATGSKRYTKKAAVIAWEELYNKLENSKNTY